MTKKSILFLSFNHLVLFFERGKDVELGQQVLDQALLLLPESRDSILGIDDEKASPLKNSHPSAFKKAQNLVDIAEREARVSWMDCSDEGRSSYLCRNQLQEQLKFLFTNASHIGFQEIKFEDRDQEFKSTQIQNKVDDVIKRWNVGNVRIWQSAKGKKQKLAQTVA